MQHSLHNQGKPSPYLGIFITFTNAATDDLYKKIKRKLIGMCILMQREGEIGNFGES